VKFPNHIILEFQANSSIDATSYWTHSYLWEEENVFIKFEVFLRSQHLIYRDLRFWSNTKYNYQKKFTIIYNDQHKPLILKEKEMEFFKNLFLKQLKVKHRLNWAPRTKRWIFDQTFVKPSILRLNKLVHLLKENLSSQSTLTFKTSKLWNVFNINFLRKERLYTKLKYSRTPAYDIVSGGSAAIFSGFLGFLICEKFGFELLDSGDFYMVLMYAVFIGFFIRMLIKLWNGTKEGWFFLSPKWIHEVVKTFVLLVSNQLKKIIAKFFSFLYFIKKDYRLK
jgi:hypothetical protein